MDKTKNMSKTGKSASLFLKNNLQAYSLGFIPLLFLLIFNYLPMAGIVIAFKSYRFDKGVFGSDWTGFKNFEFFFKSNEFLRITWNTLYLNSIFIVTGIIASVLVAILLFDLKRRSSTKVFQTILITPYFLSWVVVGYMVYALLNPSFGLMNTLLKNMGFKKIDWYSSVNAWPFILTVASIWKNFGIDSVIYYAALMGMDSGLFEAAQIDGATKWQIKKYITMPSLLPLVIIMTLLKVGAIFRADFGLFYQLTRDVGALYPTTDVIDTYIFRTMRVIGDMGMSSAVGFLQSVVGLILVVIANWASKKIDPDTGLF